MKGVGGAPKRAAGGIGTRLRKLGREAAQPQHADGLLGVGQKLLGVVIGRHRIFGLPPQRSRPRLNAQPW
jgi:hypothetical protein